MSKILEKQKSIKNNFSIGSEIFSSECEDLLDDFDSFNEEKKIDLMEILKLAIQNSDSHLSEDEVDEEIDSTINFFRIKKNSTLYYGLKSWYEFINQKMENNIRNFWDQDGYIYFTTGSGYAIYDDDLLNGSGNGETQKRFLNFLNS